MSHLSPSVMTGLLVGMLLRVFMTHPGYRQFPSVPHGTVIHLFLGFIAALLGSLAMPALLKPDYTAGVFLALGASQFHTVRNLERGMLLSLDKEEWIPRGTAYIEGMVMAFEARSFLVLAASLVATTVAILVGGTTGVLAATVAGLSFGVVTHWLTEGKQLGSIVRVEAAEEGDALVLRIHPVDFRAFITLTNKGQVQAILHDLGVRLGVASEGNRPKQPEVELQNDSPAVRIRFHPLRRDVELARQAVEQAPLLEVAHRRPFASGRSW